MIPIGDTPRTHGRPWITWLLITINIAVFAYMVSLATGLGTAPGDPTVYCYGQQVTPTEIDAFYCRWGFQPREFFDVVTGEVPPGLADRVNTTEIVLSVLTSMFIHGGWLHIGGNMLFLWVFGDNVESRFGHLSFLVFYLVGGAVASFTQAAIDLDSTVPVVGASGAVAAVLGAYLILYPTAMVHVLIPLFVIFIPIHVPAVVMIGLWFVQNLLAGVAELGAETAAGSGVAFFAHIGGFVFGAVAGLIMAIMTEAPKRRSASWRG